MEFVDRELKCIDCGAEFVFTAGEQAFFHERQLTNDPKHCKQCTATLAAEQKAAIAHRWHDTLKESYVLQLMLDLRERQEREKRGGSVQPLHRH
jgi:hypothetical protein